jgi:hypothetical protein
MGTAIENWNRFQSTRSYLSVDIYKPSMAVGDE